MSFKRRLTAVYRAKGSIVDFFLTSFTCLRKLQGMNVCLQIYSFSRLQLNSWEQLQKCVVEADFSQSTQWDISSLSKCIPVVAVDWLVLTQLLYPSPRIHDKCAINVCSEDGKNLSEAVRRQRVTVTELRHLWLVVWIEAQRAVNCSCSPASHHVIPCCPHRPAPSICPHISPPSVETGGRHVRPPAKCLPPPPRLCPPPPRRLGGLTSGDGSCPSCLVARPDMARPWGGLARRLGSQGRPFHQSFHSHEGGEEGNVRCCTRPSVSGHT